MNNNDTSNTNHCYCLILAGGKGRRLWPVSQEKRPKQFIDFFGIGKSLLQQTYERFVRFLPAENIFVSTYADYLDTVREQLPEIDDEHILCEPIRRNTAPIVAWCTHRIEQRDGEAVIVVSPSDQIVMDDERFCEDVLASMAHAKDHGCLLAMGVRPSRPEPGYGYLQLGDSSGESFYEVQSFSEKPEREFAEMFMKSGEFLWNTGLFVFTAVSVHGALAKLLPSVMRSLDNEMACHTWEDETRWVEENYSMYPNMSLETGILEHSENVCVKECHFGWADIGAWHGIYEACSTSKTDNVILDTAAQLTDTTGCVISLPHGRTAVVNGMHDFIIAENDDVLLITPRRDSSDDVVKQMTKYNMG